MLLILRRHCITRWQDKLARTMSLVSHGSSLIILTTQPSRQVTQTDVYVLYMLTSLVAHLILCIKDHLLSRLHHLDFDGDKRLFTPEQQNNLHLLNPDQFVESKIIHINYTSYDIHRA